MRESPRLTEDEILGCFILGNNDKSRAIADKATAEALKWVVEWLNSKEAKDKLRKDYLCPSCWKKEDCTEEDYDDCDIHTISILSSPKEGIEAKLKEIN